MFGQLVILHQQLRLFKQDSLQCPNRDFFFPPLSYHNTHIHVSALSLLTGSLIAKSCKDSMLQASKGSLLGRKRSGQIIGEEEFHTRSCSCSNFPVNV